MNNLISFSLKNNNFPMFKIFWKIQSIYTKKYDSEIWKDKEGNTLAHYACSHHDNELWEFAKSKPMDLKCFNNAGKAPIHTFIESSFVQNESKEKLSFKKRFFNYWIDFLTKLKELSPYIKEYLSTRKQDENTSVSISFNKELLKDLVASGADINQFREYPERKELGWTSSDYGAFSIKHILGTPLEILVSLFWEYILYTIVLNKNYEAANEYNNFFHTLTSLGANLNLIVQGNTNDEKITDAMESFPSRVVSIFFTKFIANEADYFAIRPFFIDEHINFMATDDSGNTVLHTLFARLSARKEKFSDKFCEKIIQDIAQNKNLSVAAVELENDFHMTPTSLIRGEAEHLRKFMEAYILNEKLNKTLKNKAEVKDTRGTRKI